MLAYRIPEWEHAPELVDVPVPTPGPDQALIRVGGNGLCHSDVMMHLMPEAIGVVLGWQPSFTLGHETAGWIAETGAEFGGFDEGDAVALVSPHSCGACGFCVRGRDHNCVARSAGRGYGRDGGLAEYVVVDSPRALVKLGGLDPVHAGPLTDAGATSYHAVTRGLAKLGPGSTALIIGAGGLGSFAIQFVRRLSPARVIAVDVNPSRLDIAADLGAQLCASEVDPLGMQAAVVLDFVGTNETIAAGVAACAPGGTLVLVGAADGRLHAGWYGALSKDVEIHAFQGSTIAHLHDVLALAESGAIQNPTDDYPLTHVADAYAAMEAGTLRGRAVVIP